jgi:hypothetical protein
MRPATTSATAQGQWWSTARWEKPATPIAMKLTCASETCPEVLVSSPSESSSTVVARNSVQSVRWIPAKPGTNSRKVSRAKPPMACSGHGVVQPPDRSGIACT